MRNLNSSSLADFCYTGGNCHQAGDKGGREAGEKKNREGREGGGKTRREKKKKGSLYQKWAKTAHKIVERARFVNLVSC